MTGNRIKNSKILTAVLKGLKSIIIETLILFGFILSINNYLMNTEQRINADGVGYYDYLPSVFIHHDLVRKDKPYTPGHPEYKRIESRLTYVRYEEFMVDKYPVGTAFLQLPFFLKAYFTTDRVGSAEDGYQQPFHVTIFHAALFYLFLSLVFLRKLLRSFNIRLFVIILIQVLMVFATGVVHYVNEEAAFSHVYSLFAITAFFYFARSYFVSRMMNRFYYAALMLGLVILLRQVNVIVIFFLPFLAGTWDNFREGILMLIKKPMTLIAGITAVIAVACIQCIFWYLQTGTLFLYSYQGEGFNFGKPEIFNILFSYKKGLFIYTPVLLLAFAGWIFILVRKEFYAAITWMLFFLLLTYILSSWHSWSYGCSFGLRAYIDFYPVFLILLALFIDSISVWLKILTALVALLTIPLNMIQSYQYKNYILHWFEMDKDMYWRVFLKTSDSYKGLLWKRTFNYGAYTQKRNHYVPDVDTKQGNYEVIYTASSRNIPDFDRVNLIQVRLENDFSDQNLSRLSLNINEKYSGKNLFSFSPYLFHFSDKRINEWHSGLYDFEFKPMPDTAEKEITLWVESVGQDNSLRKMQIRYLSSN